MYLMHGALGKSLEFVREMCRESGITTNKIAIPCKYGTCMFDLTLYFALYHVNVGHKRNDGGII